MPSPNMPLSLDSRGPDVKALHEALRALGYSIPKHELEEQVFGAGTQHALLAFQAKRALRRTGVLDDRTKVALARAAEEAATPQYRVEGRILYQYRLPAANLRLRLYGRTFANAPLRLAEGTTDANGFYFFAYDPGGAAANIDVRAVGAGEQEIPLAAVKFGAARHEVLNLVAPASLRPLAPEYDRLAADLIAHLGSLGKLAEAREGPDRHDLTLLHQATKWDARLIALVALAAKHSVATGLPHEVLYALFRAGLPSDPQRLARLSPASIEKALRKASQAGIVNLDAEHLSSAKAAFEKFARRTRGGLTAPGALSSLHELLAGAGLTENEEQTLVDLYLAHRGAPAELWTRARETGLADTKIDTLRLLGKLGYLTLNNAPLAASLQKEIGSPSRLALLVDKDLHRADAWKRLLRHLAQNNEETLGRLIPPAYAGPRPADRLEAYTADLARRVRVSFPTDVVRRMVDTDELRLGPDHAAVKTGVAACLKSASDLGFELGRAPVNAFIKTHRARLFPDENPDVDRTIRAVTTLARLYQTTPTGGALEAVCRLGFTSAYDIASWPYATFLQRFGGEFPTRDEATLTYRKAQQISAVTYNVATMAKLLETAPRVYTLFPRPQSPEEERREQAKARLIEHFPTLESFFGSVDFCECEQCRSVLSPAAYFVDLLRFLERQSNENSPYAALVRRRPDLPALPLSCENTNTLLPYIDIVNEILEYYVEHGDLAAGAARDTGDRSSPELLAEPQYLSAAAYHTLNDTTYPLELPFDLWLETVRRFLDQFRTPLWEVLDAFRPVEDLLADPAVALYDRAAVFAEQLGISPAEYRLFTAPDPPFWHEFYGYENAAEATVGAVDPETRERLDLNSAKTLARRLGVSYLELIDVVRSGFVDSGPAPIRFRSAVDAGCNFNETVVENADGSALSRLTFLKINLFVRLWRKLGWTIHETDRALQIFLSRNALPLTEQNIGTALRTSLVYLSHLKTLREQVKAGEHDWLGLLDLWADPPAVGSDPLAILTRALGLGGLEADVLMALSGLDPRARLDADPIAQLEADQPHRQTLRFVEVAHMVRESGFSLADLDYLLRHRDPEGNHRADSSSALTLIRTLAADLTRLRSEHTPPANATQAAALSDDVLQQKLALVLAPDVVATFMGMWSGTIEYTAIEEDVDPADQLDPDAFDDDSIHVRFEQVGFESGVQLLTFRGVLLDEEKAELTAANPSPLLAALLNAVQEQALTFFRKYLEVQSIEGETRVGFLEAADLDVIFDAERLGAERRFRLATALLQLVQDAVGRRLITQTLATSFNADPPLVDALLNNPTLLAEPDRPETPLVKAFIAAGDRGVTATFYDAQDDVLARAVVTDVDTVVIDPATGGPARPAGTSRARFEGYLEVPAPGSYRVFVAFDGSGAESELRLPHLPDFVLRGAEADGEIDEIVGDLKAGVPYRFTFDARQLTDGNVRLLIQGENLPKDGLARLNLFPDASIGRALAACTLLTKSLRLVQGFGLNEREVRYLLAHRADFGGLDWGRLPTRADAVSAEDATTLFNQFLRLAAYARLKRTLAARPDDLIRIFEASAVDAKYPLIAEVTRRPVEIVSAVAEQLHLTADDLIQEQGLWRLWHALQLVGKLGLSVTDVVAVTGIAGRENTPQERDRKVAIVDNLKAALKARFGGDAWLPLAQSVSDKLRQRKRDALVAYVLHNHVEKFDNANQLFEYFLLDPGMEPIVQTSRLRLAISSVQLFIQRCLLQLERDDLSSAINSGHWQWMKRYRVWEANRKIFLFPENWLEPEFRDDKTHLFQELEGALLQGDVSADLAEEAFFNYLKGLERIARLEIVTMYCEERADSGADIHHVIGRTTSLPHKYFYRRYAYRMWSPWEPVTAEIEGDHLVAVVWRERLHLFWVTFLERATEGTDGETTFGDLRDAPAAAPTPKAVDVQLNWSEYYQGQWTARESSGFTHSIRVPLGKDFDPKRVFVHVSTGSDGAVSVHLKARVLTSGYSWEPLRLKAFHLVSKNYPPEFTLGEDAPTPPYVAGPIGATDYFGYGALTVSSSEMDILQEGHLFRLQLGAGPSERATLARRFFYQDDEHVFFVEPTAAVATLPEFDDLGAPGLRPDPGFDLDDRWNIIPLEPEIQGIEPDFIADPDDPRWVNPTAEFSVRFASDWVTDPATLVRFDEGVIGRDGGQDFAIVPENAGEAGERVEVGQGSELPADSVLVTRGGRRAGLGEGVTVIGGGGLTSSGMRNVLERQGGRVVGR